MLMAYYHSATYTENMRVGSTAKKIASTGMMISLLLSPFRYYCEHYLLTMTD